ncbi:MAG: helix-turn-helix domain-containing protein [Alphaproteobacteria bacterium]|nr:MAG: helix-turn-helix domain-containing protein [Alphaproteobacteria bacterium]
MPIRQERIADIPRFFLYGEAAHPMDEPFVHAETIACRSREYNWTIRVHRHGDLNHMLIILAGGGTMEIDGRQLAFRAPALLVVPAGVAHGFAFDANTEGWVITMADRSWRSVAAGPAAGALFVAGRATMHELQASRGPQLDRWASLIADETGRSQQGAEAATAAALTLLLVELTRALAPRDRAESAPVGRRPALVERYRALIEVHHAEGLAVSDYAARLGVTPARLRAACQAVAGEAPIALLQARLISEAKRFLCYTDRTVAEVAYALGFDDPAYFSRLFTHRTGTTPGAYRRDQARAKAAPLA